MSARTSLLVVVTATTVFVTTVATGVGNTDVDRALLDAPTHPATSLTPALIVGEAPPAAITRLEVAVHRYTSHGLELPDLEVVFSSDEADCDGARGLFSAGADRWRINICSDEVDTVFEHELAHAWERATLTDVVRQRFMRENGYAVWRSHEVPWDERAVEGIAVVIQQGLSGLPLPPVLGKRAVERLRTYESLTGQPDPRLIEWLGATEVGCEARPTALSTMIPDDAGIVCGGEISYSADL